MTPSLWLRDIASLAIQLTFVVCAGAAAFYALRIRDSRISLLYWRGLLLLCLVLPLGQGRATVSAAVPGTGPEPAGQAQAIGVGIAGSEARTAPMPMMMRIVTSPQVVLGCLAGGALARSIWLVLGASRLRRLRRTASPLHPLPAPFHRAQTQVGVTARFLVSERLGGPVTFGLFDPVVILPSWIHRAETHVQEAIAYHELIHVRRRDWLDEILEEVVRSIFWFHPAIRWLIGRVQLTREQVVDQSAIQLTASRDRYVQALLAVALTRSPVALVPAPLFLRRHLLKRRVAQILEATAMTTRQFIASFTVAGLVVALTAAAAVRSFPLLAQAPEPGGDPIQIVKGGEHLLHASMPEYPRRAVEQRVEGDVTLDLTLNDRGEVSDARVLSGPEELRKAALESALGWHYSPSELRSTSTIATLRFRVPPAHAEFDGRSYETVVRNGEQEEKKERSPAQRRERLLMELERALADPNITDEQKAEYTSKQVAVKLGLAAVQAERGAKVEGSSRLVEIKTERLPQETVAEILAHAGVRIGDEMTEDVARRIRAAVRQVDEHVRVSFGGDGKGGTVVAIIAP